MKTTNLLLGIALSMTTALMFTACKKEAPIDPHIPVINNSARNGGVVPDDASALAKVPMLVSADFLKHNPGPMPVISMGRGKADNIAPTVGILSPGNGATVSGTVGIAASASDNVGLSLVTASVDGVVVASLNAPPYNFNWNSGTVANGTHSIMVTAKDLAGNTKSASIQISSSNTAPGDITRPIVSISSPANGAAVSGTISLSSSASDNVGVSSVSYEVDGTSIGSSSNPPYSVTWNSASVANGIHTITAKAADAAGNTGVYSIQVTVNTTVINPPTLPASVQLMTPPVGDQGNEWSCVAFAVVYGARSIEQYYKTNATSYSVNTNIFSPEYAYNQTKFGDCGSGTAFQPVLDLLQNQGVSTWQFMPYSDLNGCSIMPNSSQLANALNYKISSYSKLFNTDQVAIKTMIASKHPVIASILMDNSFVNAGPDFIWQSYSGSGNLPHAMLICGYDDTKHAYKIMNSWGTRWGDAGFSWIDYDLFPKQSSYYTYVIQ